MKRSRLYTTCMLLLIGCIAFISCDGKDYTTGMPESKLINEITIDNLKSSELALAVDMDSIIKWTVYPVDLEDKSIIWGSSDESIAKVSQDGKITAVSPGTAIITISPNIGFGPTEAVKSIPVKVLTHIVKAASIVFTSTETQLYERSSLALIYDILPTDHTYDYLTWSSSDESLATVDEKGVVKGVNPGWVTITAYTHDKSGVKGSYAVEVLESIVATDVSIAADQEFALYETYPLNFTLMPANATRATIKWKSSDPTVATIDENGDITTLKYGSTMITATTADGVAVEESIIVPEGFFRKDFSDGIIYPWSVLSGGTVSFADGKMVVKFNAGAKYRADLVLAAKEAPIKKISLDVGKYRYFAIKMLVANNLVVNQNSKGCVVLDTNNGRYKQTTGGGNNTYFTYLKNNEVWDWSKPAVYYYDMQEEFGNSKYYYSKTNPVELTTFKFVIADYPSATSNDNYQVYWIRSFKTLEELKTFVDNE